MYNFNLSGGDTTVGGHRFSTHNFTVQWCDVCGRFMWGLIRQGMKCEGKEEGKRVVVGKEEGRWGKGCGRVDNSQKMTNNF